MDKADRLVLENIQKFGCQVMHIAAEDDLPPFAYSVGIQQTTSVPEVVVIGLKQPMAHFVVNEYNNRVRNGELFVPGQKYSGFIGGFDVLVSVVDKSYYEEYFGVDLWLYKGPNFDVVQLIYPSTSGVWPWQSQASDGFKAWQPVLSKASNGPQSAL